MIARASLSILLTRLRHFIDWWAAELSELVATQTAVRAWQILFLRREAGSEVFVRLREGVVQVGTPQTESDQLVAELRRRFRGRKVRSAQIVLRLQPREVVQNQISVPAAARDVMEPVLRNQVERLAPWPAEKALFAYEIAGASSEPGMLDVHLVVTGRAMVEGLVGEFEGLGYGPGVVDYGTDPDPEPRLNLLPREELDDYRSGRRLLSLVAFVCGVALIVCAIGVFDLVQNTRELGRLNSRLDELRAKAKPDRDAERSARRQRRQTWLAAAKQAQPSVAIALEALSRALPDDSWLNRLEMSQGLVTLAGNATNAAAIIGHIEASGHFADVQFAAPTTRTEDKSYESFTITAKIVIGKELEP